MSQLGSDTAFNEYLASVSDDYSSLINNGDRAPLSPSMMNNDTEAETRNFPEIGGFTEYLLSTPEIRISEPENPESPVYEDLTNDSLAQLLFSWGLCGELYHIFKGK